MDTDTLEKGAAHLLAAIENCMANKFNLPAVMLMYSAMDIMAWLNRDEQNPDVTKNDFVHWVDTFLLPNSGLPCTAVDLYGARCALLHSYTAESKLSREGNASRIYYAWGTAQEQDLQELIDWVRTHNAKAVHVDKLFTALQVGTTRFLLTIDRKMSSPVRPAKAPWPCENRPGDIAGSWRCA